MIRNLVDNEDEDDRQLQRTKLENDLSVASERLDNLVLGMFVCMLSAVLIRY